MAKEYQLQLEMDEYSHELLKWLQDAIEAASLGEVIRRALQAYEVFTPDDFNKPVSDKEYISAPSYDTGFKSRSTRRVHVRVPHRTKERLDRAKLEERSTYSEIIRQSLRVLAQLIRIRQATINENASENDTNSHHAKSQLCSVPTKRDHIVRGMSAVA